MTDILTINQAKNIFFLKGTIVASVELAFLNLSFKLLGGEWCDVTEYVFCFHQNLETVNADKIFYI